MALVFTMLCVIFFFFMGVKKFSCIYQNIQFSLNLHINLILWITKNSFVSITYKMVICIFLHICSHYKDETTLVGVNVIKNWYKINNLMISFTQIHWYWQTYRRKSVWGNRAIQPLCLQCCNYIQNSYVYSDNIWITWILNHKNAFS